MIPSDSPALNIEQQTTPHSSSFKDPSGFIFTRNETIYRQINHRYTNHYDWLLQSGLYADLVKRNWLIEHEETNTPFQSEEGYKVIQPRPVRHISYPYEWSFSQLKDAALLTLKIAKKSLSFNMILKDATPFNIQFVKGAPLFIDTLSFERYKEGEPWVAYRQFCETFLAPLALISYCNELAQGRLITHIHGLSIKDTSTRLPLRSHFNTGMLVHIHFQSWFQGNTTKEKKTQSRSKLPQRQLLALLTHLENTVKGLASKENKGVWGAYYQTGILDQEYVIEKSAIMARFIENPNTSYTTAIDLGSNSGHFSTLLAEREINVVAVDSEHSCIDELYQKCTATNIQNILPLLIDLTNPSPSIGWMNTERHSFIERYKADLVVALALVHHLVIGRNVPFEKVAQFCAQLGKDLIIEFIPKTDPKVQILLAHREDVFEHYTQQCFLKAFLGHFNLKEEVAIEGTERILYLFTRK